MIGTLVLLLVFGSNIFCAMKIIKSHEANTAFYWAIATSWFGFLALGLFDLLYSDEVKINQKEVSITEWLQKLVIFEVILTLLVLSILVWFFTFAFHGDLGGLPSVLLLLYIWFLPLLTLFGTLVNFMAERSEKI